MIAGMSRKPTPPPDDPEQSKRFPFTIDTQLDIEVLSS